MRCLLQPRLDWQDLQERRLKSKWKPELTPPPRTPRSGGIPAAGPRIGCKGGIFGRGKRGRARGFVPGQVGVRGEFVGSRLGRGGVGGGRRIYNERCRERRGISSGARHRERGLEENDRICGFVDERGREHCSRWSKRR